MEIAGAPQTQTCWRVFLSYSRKDKESVQRLARLLADFQDIVVWWDLWNLIPGEPWQPAIEKALLGSDVCLVFVGPGGLATWHHEEMQAAIDRRVKGSNSFYRVIPVLLPGASAADGDALPLFLQSATCVEFRHDVDDEEQLHRLVAGIRGVPPGRFVSSAHDESASTRWDIRIEARLELLDNAALDRIIQEIKRLSRDQKIVLSAVEEDSVRLSLGGSFAGFERVRAAFISGSLENLAGRRVLSVTGGDASRLKDRVADWNRWRKMNPDTIPILIGADLSKLQLNGANLREAYLDEANLSGTSMRGADLRGAKFYKANLRFADLTGAVLSRADLAEASLIGATLRGANLRGASLAGANLVKATLVDADLREVNLSAVQISDEQLAVSYLTKDSRGDELQRRSSIQLKYGKSALRAPSASVVIRGFRVALGEIESTLERHPAVRQAVVLAREDQPGNKRLVAYVVAEQDLAPTVSETRRFLEQHLSGHMIPSAFLMLQELPLTPTGKLDRRALPAPDAKQSEMVEEFMAPRTAYETMLADLWSEVLRVEHVSVHDNFLDLGGDSLIALQVVTRLEEEHAFQIALKDLMFQTLGQIASACETQGAATAKRP